MSCWKYESKSGEAKRAHANLMLKLGDKSFWMAFVISGGSILTIDKVNKDSFQLIILSVVVFTVLGVCFMKLSLNKLDKVVQEERKEKRRSKLAVRIRGSLHPND